MRVGIVSLDNSDEILSGGKHIHQQLLERGLLSQDCEVIKFFPNRSLYFLFCRVLFKILSLLKLKNRSSIMSWTLNRHCSNLLHQMKQSEKHFDIIFSQDPVSAVAVGRYLDSSNYLSKHCLTLHGYLSLEIVNYGNFKGREKEKVIEAALVYEREALKNIDALITVDSKISYYIKEKFKFDKNVSILKNAIDVDAFGKTHDIESKKKEWSIDLTKKLILVPRRLVRKNGVDIAIGALSRLLEKKNQSIHLLIAGEGPELNNLISLQKELGVDDKSITFLGSVNHDDVISLYDISDIILIPSVIRDGVEEATSLSMLEGMAAKKIVITSNIGGMKEVISSGVNGFLFKQANEDELAECIERALSMKQSEKKMISHQAFNDVMDNHHFVNHTKKYIEIALRETE